MIKNRYLLFLLLLPWFNFRLSFGKTLYESDKELSEQKIEVFSYGSGMLKESKELSKSCLRLESNNLYSGGEILFSNPIDINSLWSNRNLLLTFDFIQGGTGFIINKKDSPALKSRRKFNIKVSLLQSNEQGGEINFSVEPGTSKFGFPLHAVKGLSPTQAITGLKMSTSSEECLYFTRIHFEEDQTTIKGKFLDCIQEIGLGEEIKFKAEGFGGTTPLQFNWSVNPTSIFQIDGMGSEWSYRFLKPGTYSIRLIISDMFGLKKSYITSKKIVVNP